MIPGQFEYVRPGCLDEALQILRHREAMTVDRAHARHLAEHDGVVYAFCRMGCRTAFIREPAAYTGAVTSARDA